LHFLVTPSKYLYLRVVIILQNYMISSISPQGQVTIPKKIRDILSLRRGDQIAFSYEGDVVIFRKVNSEDLCNFVKQNASTAPAVQST